MPGIHGLSFVDDIGWWGSGKDDREVAGKLSAAAKVAVEWAEGNRVSFDHGKTEAALFYRSRKKRTTATVMVAPNAVPFNKEATRWLGIWLDFQLTLKEHHDIGTREGKQAMTRLRRLTGQMGRSPANCRKVMMACIQSVAMFGAELWWKGDHVTGTMGRAQELQRLINQQAQATMGCFRTTNLGALRMEASLRAATAQLENRQRWFRLRLLSLPQGDQALKVVGAPTELDRRLTNALAHSGSSEGTVLLEEPEALDAVMQQTRKREPKWKQKKPGQDSPSSQMGHGWRMERLAMQWCEGRGNPGQASKLIWDITRRPMMRSVLRSPVCWRWRRGEGRLRNELPSLQMCRRPSDGWHRTHQGQGSSTPSRHESTLPRCAGPGQASSSKPDGTLLTRGLPATRRPTSGQKSLQRSQTPAG